jgi:hypothetical protein
MDIIIFLITLSLSFIHAYLFKKTLSSIEPIYKEWVRAFDIENPFSDYERSHYLIMARCKLKDMNNANEPADDVIAFLSTWKAEVDEYINNHNAHKLHKPSTTIH